MRARAEVGLLLRDAREGRKVTRGFDLREGRIRHEVGRFSHHAKRRAEFIGAPQSGLSRRACSTRWPPRPPRATRARRNSGLRGSSSEPAKDAGKPRSGLASDPTARQLAGKLTTAGAYTGIKRRRSASMVFEEPPARPAADLVGELRTRLHAIPGVDSHLLHDAPDSAGAAAAAAAAAGAEAARAARRDRTGRRSRHPRGGRSDRRHRRARAHRRARVCAAGRDGGRAAAHPRLLLRGGAPLRRRHARRRRRRDRARRRERRWLLGRVACALVSYVLHGDVDARPLLEDEAAAVQHFLYLAAAASLATCRRCTTRRSTGSASCCRLSSTLASGRRTPRPPSTRALPIDPSGPDGVGLCSLRRRRARRGARGLGCVSSSG